VVGASRDDAQIHDDIFARFRAAWISGAARSRGIGKNAKITRDGYNDTDQCSKLLKNAGYMLLNRIDHLIFCFSRSRSSSS
jgi:hypothetical protein